MNKKIKNFIFYLWKNIILFFNSHINDIKIQMNNLKLSIFAILSGILISCIIISINEVNCLLFFKFIFKLAFHPLLKNHSLTYWAIYIIAGLSMIISLKAGLFNIGISGQMLLSGAIIFIIGIKNPNISKIYAVIISLLIAILAGGLLGIITSIFKIFFNIHEIVSCVMINWIIWYLIKWIFMHPSFGLWDYNKNSTIDIATYTNNFNLIINQQTWIFPFIIAIILIIFFIFLYNKTIFGFYTKIINNSKHISWYIGINTKFYIIITMFISGSCAGIVGMLYYMIQSTALQFNIDELPEIGFDAISIALIAFNNSLFLIPIALLWAIVKTTIMQITQLPDFQMSKQMGQLIFGIIIYMSAIMPIFAKFNFLCYIKTIFFIYFKHKNINKYFIKYKKQIKIFFYKINNFNNQYVGKTQKNNLNIKKNQKEISINNIKSELLIIILNTNIFQKKLNFFILNNLNNINIKEKKNRIKYQNNLFFSLINKIKNFLKINNKYMKKKEQKKIIKIIKKIKKDIIFKIY